MSSVTPNIRFREARELTGLSPEELAIKCGVRDANIRDIEEIEPHLTCCYSPCNLRKFCQVLKIRPAELFGEEISELPVSCEELARLIHEECRSRNITLEQFEDAVGWRLSDSIEHPELLLELMTIDGLQWLCRELRIDWRRAL